MASIIRGYVENKKRNEKLKKGMEKEFTVELETLNELIIKGAKEERTKEREEEHKGS